MGVTSEGRVSGRFFDIKVSTFLSFVTDAQIERAELYGLIQVLLQKAIFTSQLPKAKTIAR